MQFSPKIVVDQWRSDYLRRRGALFDIYYYTLLLKQVLLRKNYLVHSNALARNPHISSTLTSITAFVELAKVGSPSHIRPSEIAAPLGIFHVERVRSRVRSVDVLLTVRRHPIVTCTDTDGCLPIELLMPCRSDAAAAAAQCPQGSVIPSVRWRHHHG